jgi:hypothetical protein
MYTFKKFSLDKIDDLLYIFKSSNKLKVSKEKFIKKYNTDYLGISYVGYLAYDEFEKPAAFYCVIPVLITNEKKEEILIAQSADTITHPLHQKKGLFITLAEMTYNLAMELNIEFLFGIPNYLSYPGFVKKLKWQHTGFMQIFRIRVNTLPLAYLSKKNNSFNSFYQKYTHFIISVLFKKETTFCLNSTIYEIKANENYKNYKNYNKKYFIKIDDVVLWITIDNFLKIGDIQGLNEENIILFIKKIKLISFSLGCHKIVFQCNKTNNLFKVFSSQITPSEGLPIIFKNLTNNYTTENISLKYSDIDTF